MQTLLNRTWAFIRRDFQIETSYRFHLLLQVTSGFFIVVLFYFIAKLISPDSSHQFLQQYEADYFSFVLIGVAAGGLLYMGLSGFTDRLRNAMSEGALEMMFACPTLPILIIILPSVWGFFFEAFKAILIVLFGVFFGADLGQINLIGALVVLFFTITSYSVFGLLSASIIMVLKRGDPVNSAFSAASTLISGAYFPVELLPSWLGAIAKILPMTYAFHGLRMTILAGESLMNLKTELTVLVLFSVIGLPIAIKATELAIRRAKRDGSLGIF